MATAEQVRAVAISLPRTEEALVRDRVKFRIKQIVYVALSPDETVMGFAFPKDEREALVEAEPDKFLMPVESDLRYNWVRVRLPAIDEIEMEELVIDAWRMCVPQGVAASYLASRSSASSSLEGPAGRGNEAPAAASTRARTSGSSNSSAGVANSD